jgi:hypothetical protein
MEIDVWVAQGKNYPREVEKHFTLLSPVYAEEEGIELSLQEGIREVVSVDDRLGIHNNVQVARACNEIGEEGFLVWGGIKGVRVLDDQAMEVTGLPRGIGHAFLWLEHIEAFPRELWPILRADREEEEEDEDEEL